jgi:hypothetical protein
MRTVYVGTSENGLPPLSILNFVLSLFLADWDWVLRVGWQCICWSPIREYLVPGSRRDCSKARLACNAIDITIRVGVGVSLISKTIRPQAVYDKRLV